MRALIISTVLALVVAGGAFAFYTLDPLNAFHAGPQAAEALPADALFYAGLDLDPSAEQKVEALRFLNHFPAFRNNSGLENENSDVREQVFSDAIDSAGCSGISYADTIQPWLGDKFGIALMPAPAGTQDPAVAVAVEVTDESKATAGLSQLSDCADASGGTSFGYAFTGDYALVAQTQDQADTYVNDAERSALADNADFVADMDSLGDLGVATVWVNVAGAIDSYGDGLGDVPGVSSQLDALKQSSQRAAATFRFASDHVDIASSVYSDTPPVSHGDNQIVNLPDSTVFAVSVAGGADRLNRSWPDIMAALESQGADVQQQLADFEQQTGLAVPADLETLLGENVMLAVDSGGLTSDALQTGDPSQLNIGVRFTGDAAKLDDLYNRITKLIEAEAGQTVPISKVDASDGLAVATNDSYGDTLAKLDGSLGSSDQFTSVTDDAASQDLVLFFDFDAIEGEVVQAMQDDGVEQRVIDNVTPIRAFGVTSKADGHYTLATMRMSVND